MKITFKDLKMLRSLDFRRSRVEVRMFIVVGEGIQTEWWESCERKKPECMLKILIL